MMASLSLLAMNQKYALQLTNIEKKKTVLNLRGGVIYQAVMSHPHFYTIYHQNPDIYHCKFSRLPLLKPFICQEVKCHHHFFWFFTIE